MGIVENVKKAYKDFGEKHPVALKRIKIGTCVAGGLFVSYKIGKSNGLNEGKKMALKEIEDNKPALPSSEPEEYRLDWVDPYYVTEPNRGVIGKFFYEDTGEQLSGYVKYTEDCAEEYIEDYGYKGDFEFPEKRVELDYANDTYEVKEES